MESPRILLVAPRYSYRIAAYVKAARELGLRLDIVSDGEYSLISEIAAGLHIDFTNPEEAIRRIQADAALAPVHAVIASEDRSVTLAAQIAQALHLPHNSPDSAQISRRKDLSRTRLRAAGLPIPAHRVLNLDDILAAGEEIDASLGFPGVVKPLSLSASTGVIRVDNQADFLQACRRLKPIIANLSDRFEASHIQLEDYVGGVEVAVEALLDAGRLQVLAVMDKPDPLHGPYFEETYYVTPSRLPQAQQDLIVRRIAKACKAMGINTGPVHAELRLDGRDAWIIEIASRTIGGDCARILEFVHGRSLESLVLANALGKPLSLHHRQKEAKQSAAGVMMIPTPKPGILRRVEGILAAQSVPHIESIQLALREGHELVCLPEGSSYLGFIFAKAESPEEVEQALRDAFAKLKIVVAPLFKLSAI